MGGDASARGNVGRHAAIGARTRVAAVAQAIAIIAIVIVVIVVVVAVVIVDITNALSADPVANRCPPIVVRVASASLGGRRRHCIGAALAAQTLAR